MSRPLRIEYAGAWYHVMNRGRRGEDVFSGKEDCVIFIALLQEAVELWDVRVSAYCLISNHYHITAQRGKSNEPRNVAIYLCRILRNGTLMELGQVFGMTGYSPAGSAVERVKKKLSKDRNLQKRIEKIKQSLLAPKGSNGDLTP